MPKLRIRRSEDLRNIPNNIYPNEAISKLESVGWVLQRNRNHNILRKGKEAITLPTTGQLSSWTTQLTYKAWWRDKALLEGEEVDLDEEALPLTTFYRNEVYAVLGKDHGFYQIQDLTTGNKQSVPVADCLDTPPEELTSNLDLPKTKTEEATAIVAPEKPPADPLLNQDTIYGKTDFMRVTQKYVSGLKVREDQLLAEALRVERERKELEDFLGRLSGRLQAEPVGKRTVLPPTGKIKKRVFLTDKQWEDVLEKLKGGGTPDSLASQYNISLNNLYKHIGSWRREGKLTTK